MPYKDGKFVEPTNTDRAEWAEEALQVFMKRTGSDIDTAVGDLLADLMHWCDTHAGKHIREGEEWYIPTFAESMENAEGNHREERRMEEKHTVHFNRFALDLPYAAVMECSAQGRVDDSVKYWHNELSGDLAKIDTVALRNELREFGAWSKEELEDREANEQRILWVAACQIRDELKVSQNLYGTGCAIS